LPRTHNYIQGYEKPQEGHNAKEEEKEEEETSEVLTIA
jgi:hypothetical protein